jgi:hypothetical protein
MPIAFDEERNPTKFRYDAVIAGSPPCDRPLCSNDASFDFRFGGRGNQVFRRSVLLCFRCRYLERDDLAMWLGGDFCMVIEFCTFQQFSNTRYYAAKIEPNLPLE